MRWMMVVEESLAKRKVADYRTYIQQQTLVSTVRATAAQCLSIHDG